MRLKPDYPRDVGMFKDKFHSIDAIRPDDSYPLNVRHLRDSLHAQNINPGLSGNHNGMGIAHNPLFMRDKRSELKKKKREQKKTKAKGKAKGGNNKVVDDKEPLLAGGNESGEGGGKGGGGGKKKGKKN